MPRHSDSPDKHRQIEVAAAVNDPKVLANCLERSPAIASGRARLRTDRGYATAGLAYNPALADSDATYLVLVHQDVYLPSGLFDRLVEQLELLDRMDPDWAVAGVIGLDEDGAVRGQTWSSGLQLLVGSKVTVPKPATTLDEVLLVVRLASDIRFDEHLPSFHLYATDIVQIARHSGRGAYVIDAPVIHHSRAVVNLSGGYSAAYRYLQHKWRASLPLPNLICPIQPSSLQLRWRNMRMLIRNFGRTTRVDPPSDPVTIAKRLGLEDFV